MDPDAALEEIRALMNDGDSADVRLIELFEGLDQWLSQGGFPPAPWRGAHSPLVEIWAPDGTGRCKARVHVQGRTFVGLLEPAAETEA